MRRTGTVALCAFLVTALAGAFGSGPLSRAEVRSVDELLAAHYQRFTRNRSGTTLHITVRQRGQGGDLVQLSLNRSFAEAIQLNQILPEPRRVAGAADQYVFEFATTGSDSIHVVFRYRPESLGSLHVIASAGGSQLRFRQFVDP